MALEAVIYIGPTKKVGKFDLKHNRVYTDRPTSIIQELQGEGYKLIDKLFVPVEKVVEEEEKLHDTSSPVFLANKQISR